MRERQLTAARSGASATSSRGEPSQGTSSDSGSSQQFYTDFLRNNLRTIGSWLVTGDMGSARYTHTANVLPSGKVLVTGGRTYTSTPYSTAELYLP